MFINESMNNILFHIVSDPFTLTLGHCRLINQLSNLAEVFTANLSLLASI